MEHITSLVQFFVAQYRVLVTKLKADL